MVAGHRRLKMGGLKLNGGRSYKFWQNIKNGRFSSNPGDKKENLTVIIILFFYKMF
jgi:hypothetical protein